MNKIAMLLISVLLVAGCAPDKKKPSVIERASQSVLKLEDPNGGGSGFAMRAKSGKVIVITNAHVCDEDSSMLGSSRTIKKQPLVVMGSDTSVDLCALMAPKGIQPLELSNSLNMGARVVILGHPYLNDLTITLSRVFGYDTPFNLREIELDSPVFPGNSGGPVIDLNTGKVVGAANISNTLTRHSYAVMASSIRAFLDKF